MSVREIFIGKDRASLAKLIGKGGEGEVYAIKGRSGKAAKIYNASLRAKRENKVRAMVDKGLAAKTDLVAYPSEIVTDRQGNFLGFAMRHVSGYLPLHELYTPMSRRRHFQKVDYRFLIRAAQNVARAVWKVHMTGCVIGDLNHSGVLVAQNATVALIDADSFQFSLNGRTYPCEVGVEDYTPPELQGKTFGSVRRTIEHDNFGLAVAIFHLLFMGNHPYVGRSKNPNLKLGETIAQNRFAYSLTRQDETQTSPPRTAMTLNLFPDAIIHSFETAFSRTHGARPGAQEWLQALNKLAADLNRCSTYKTHYYPRSAQNCIWCELASFGLKDMFPSAPTAAPNIPTYARGTEKAVLGILAYRLPSTADILPSTAKPSGPSSKLRKAKVRKRWRLLISPLVGVTAFAMVILVILISIKTASLVPLLVAIMSIPLISKIVVWFLRGIQTDPFLQAFKDADEQVQLELDAFVLRNNLTYAVTEFKRLRGELNDAITAYKNLNPALVSEMRVLRSNREDRQRQTYLDGFLIRRADITGIGTVNTYTLHLFGIQTAADIDRSAVLRVPGLDDDKTNQLLNWRRGLESQFRYDRTPNAQDVADEQALRDKFAAKSIKIRSKIHNRLGALRRDRALFDDLPAKARGDSTLIRTLGHRAQAARDLELLGVSVPASNVKINFSPPPLR